MTLNLDLEVTVIFMAYIDIKSAFDSVDRVALWKANRKPYPSFQMLPLSMTFSDLSKSQ